MTIDNQDSTTNTDPKMIQDVSELGLFAVVDLLVPRSGNVDVTNR